MRRSPGTRVVASALLVAACAVLAAAGSAAQRPTVKVVRTSGLGKVARHVERADALPLHGREAGEDRVQGRVREVLAAVARQRGHEAGGGPGCPRLEARHDQAPGRRAPGHLQRPCALPVCARQEGRRRQGPGGRARVVRDLLLGEDRHARGDSPAAALVTPPPPATATATAAALLPLGTSSGSRRSAQG